MGAYAFPPFALISHLLAQVRSLKMSLILILRKLCDWCIPRTLHLTSASVVEGSHFLASLFSEGKAYCSINLYCSSISGHYDLVSGCLVGRQPLICHLLRGAHISHPPIPKYSHLWGVSLVLDLFCTWPDNDSLPLHQLSAKLTLLLCLLSFHRLSEYPRFRSLGYHLQPRTCLIPYFLRH